MIYLFDKEEQLIKVIRKNAIKSALQTYALTTENYVSDRLTVEMKALNDDEFEKVEYVAIQSMEDTHLFHYFYIAQKKTVGDITTFTGVQSGIEELRKTPVFDKRPKNTPAKPVINELLQGTNWQARYIADTTNHSTNFYYTSVFDALKKICKVWGLEMQFFVEMNSNGLGARYIDFKKKIGEAVGKRVVYGHNALEILKEIERTNIYTALVGRGKGEQVSSAEESGKEADGYGRKITFESVVWSKAKGNPLDKPLGQRYLEDPEMTRRYGIKNADGTMRAKIGFVDFNEEENPNELIKLTYQALVNASRPQLTLKTSSVYLKGVKIGDTIRVVRHDKKLDYDTRVFEITFNRLNNQSSDIKLGDQISESANSKIQSVADKAVEDFINNEFNSFVKNLPDFVKSADGYNTNWYSVEDPVKKYPKKVLINDIWYKPDPEHEGHTIMQRWTGEAWEEILRTYNEVSLREKIDQKFNELKQTTDQAIQTANQKAEEALKKAGTIPDTARLSEQIKRQVLESQDLTKKVTETLKETDSGVIYNKILQNIKTEFVQKTKFDELERSANNGISYLMNKSDKAEIEIRKQTIEFNKLTESNKIYERILGTSETEAPDKLSRLVMSSEIFQTEVGKYSTTGGPNMLRNSRADDGLKFWNGDPSKFKFLEHHFYLNGQKRMFLLENGAVVNSPRFIFKRNTDYILNLTAFDANTARVIIELRKRKKDSANQDYDERQIIFDKTGSPAFNSDKAVKRTFKFNTGDFDNGYLLFSYDGIPNVWSGMFMTELDFYEGTADRKWQPAPEDSEEPIEAVRTQVTQLAGSWSVRNLTSAGDVLGAINLNPDGSVRINEGLLSVGEKTIIKDGVIKKSMIGEAQIGTAHIDEIDASKANLINVTSKNVATEGLTANIIKGGKLSSLNGVTDFDLQTGWLEMNKEAVGIRNRFEGKPMQFLIFGQGAINGVPCAYTQLMSNRNGQTGIEHTSAGIQIWNGRLGNNVQTAITFYGKSMDFIPNSQGGGVTLNTETRDLDKLHNVFLDNALVAGKEIFLKGNSLVTLFNLIDKNFKGIEDHLKRANLGAPGYYRTNI